MLAHFQRKKKNECAPFSIRARNRLRVGGSLSQVKLLNLKATQLKNKDHSRSLQGRRTYCWNAILEKASLTAFQQDQPFSFASHLNSFVLVFRNLWETVPAQSVTSWKATGSLAFKDLPEKQSFAVSKGKLSGSSCTLSNVSGKVPISSFRYQSLPGG